MSPSILSLMVLRRFVTAPGGGPRAARLLRQLAAASAVPGPA